MARTWFAGSATAPMDPPSRAAVPNTSHDPASSNQSVSYKNQIAVHESATAHSITPTTKATHFDSISDIPVAWTTPFTSPQKEPSTQPAKKPFDGSAILTKLIEQHSKPKESPTAASFKSKDPRLSEPAAMMDALAPSPSAPHRAPIAQMVPLPSNAAVTTTPAAAITIPDASTTFPLGPSPSTMGASNSQAFFPVAAPTLLPPSSLLILPSQPTATPKKRPQQTSTPKKTPKITITSAPATAPSAFKDAVLASHVQNTKFLSPPTKQQTNGIKKRQYIKKNRLPPKSSSTADSVPGEKRGPGRPRTSRIEEQPPQQKRQHRPSLEPPTQSTSRLSTVSTLPIQQEQTPIPRSKTNSTPTLCSEEPRLWPGRGDYVASLLRFNVKPETIHSEPIQACANRAAHHHQDPQENHPHGHGVCTACRHCAYRHIKATRSDLLLGSAWWPLCKTCGDREMLRIEPSRKGCSCYSAWLCFSCLVEVVERRGAVNGAEAENRRRTLIGKRMMDGDDRTVTTGWACECGEEVGPGPTLMKCIGCQGMRVGKVDPQETTAREERLRNTALAWT